MSERVCDRWIYVHCRIESHLLFFPLIPYFSGKSMDQKAGCKSDKKVRTEKKKEKRNEKRRTDDKNKQANKTNPWNKRRVRVEECEVAQAPFDCGAAGVEGAL
jgi:hypothetical protein